MTFQFRPGDSPITKRLNAQTPYSRDFQDEIIFHEKFERYGMVQLWSEVAVTFLIPFVMIL